MAKHTVEPGQTCEYVEFGYPASVAGPAITVAAIGRLATTEEKVADGLIPQAGDHLVVYQGIRNRGDNTYEPIPQGWLWACVQNSILRVDESYANDAVAIPVLLRSR